MLCSWGRRFVGVRSFEAECPGRISQYLDHTEYKYDGDEGFLERKHIYVSDIIHIGKEANNIDNEPLDGGNVQVFGTPRKNE
jgi:hypothetical protein